MLAAAQERRDPRVSLGGRPAAGGAGPSTRRAPGLRVRGRRRAAQSRILQNRSARLGKAQPVPVWRLVPPYKETIGVPGACARTPQAPGRRLVPPYKGDDSGAGCLGACTFSKKEKTFSFLEKGTSTRASTRPKLLFFISCSYLFCWTGGSLL